MEKKTYIEGKSDTIRGERKDTYEGNGVCREQRLEDVYSRKNIPLFEAELHRDWINIYATTRLGVPPCESPPHGRSTVVKVGSEGILRCHWPFVVLSPHPLVMMVCCDVCASCSGVKRSVNSTLRHRATKRPGLSRQVIHGFVLQVVIVEQKAQFSRDSAASDRSSGGKGIFYFSFSLSL